MVMMTIAIFKVFLGDSSNLQASMTWKGFDLSMNWAGAAGFKIDYYKQG